MFKLFDSGLCPIGIDAGSHAVHMAQFRASGTGLKLQAACRIELESLEGELKGAAVYGGGRSSNAMANEDFLRQGSGAIPARVVYSCQVGALPQMPDSDPEPGFALGGQGPVWLRGWGWCGRGKRRRGATGVV